MSKKPVNVWPLTFQISVCNCCCVTWLATTVVDTCTIMMWMCSSCLYIGSIGHSYNARSKGRNGMEREPRTKMSPAACHACPQWMRHNIILLCIAVGSKSKVVGPYCWHTPFYDDTPTFRAEWWVGLLEQVKKSGGAFAPWPTPFLRPWLSIIMHAQSDVVNHSGLYNIGGRNPTS